MVLECMFFLVLLTKRLSFLILKGKEKEFWILIEERKSSHCSQFFRIFNITLTYDKSFTWNEKITLLLFTKKDYTWKVQNKVCIYISYLHEYICVYIYIEGEEPLGATWRKFGMSVLYIYIRLVGYWHWNDDYFCWKQVTKIGRDAVLYVESLIESIMGGLEGLINILDSEGGFGSLEMQVGTSFSFS